MQHLSDDVLTLLQLPRLDAQQLKSAWFAALDGAGVTLRVEPVARAALPGWIAQRLARQGQRVSDGDEGQRTLGFFADRVEGNLLAAQQEIKKLGLLCPPGEISLELLEDSIANVSRFNPFQMVEAIQEQCAIWPHAQRPADFRTPLGGDIPTLVLEGELDPVTPPRYGEAVIKHLGNAKLIVAKGQGHNVIGRGCLPKLVAGFMDALNPTTLDATCVDALGPMPHFIDFNGAAP